jgi:nicotinamidase-related amidase
VAEAADAPVADPELEQLLEPSGSALVLVDLQVDFCDPEGAFGRLGADLTAYPAVVTRVERLLAAAREAGVLVVHLQNTTMAGDRASSPAQRRFARRLQQRFRPEGPFEPVCEAGSPGHAFLPALAPRPEEPVVPKYRSSGFAGTPLDLILRSNGIGTVVLVGATTEGCVESTARDGLFLDYSMVVVADGVASDDAEQHAASMLLMRHRFDVVPAATVLRAWKGVAA